MATLNKWYVETKTIDKHGQELIATMDFYYDIEHLSHMAKSFTFFTREFGNHASLCALGTFSFVECTLFDEKGEIQKRANCNFIEGK